MSFRVGIVSLIHESNTFIGQPTTLDHFSRDTLLEGESVRAKLADTLHEIGGFFTGLAAGEIEAVPLFAARALPYGTIDATTADELVKRLLDSVDRGGKLDGYLVGSHGAAVAENHPDFDGHWLMQLREQVGSVPIIGTLDLHANLSPRMVAACDALIAYRTNPHLDQKERGLEAASLMKRTLHGECHPTMAAAFPALAANIERQATAESHWEPLLKLRDEQHTRGAISNSLLYGFPYADVPEMGSSVIAVTDNDRDLAERLAQELAAEWWTRRADFAGELISIPEAVKRAASLPGPVCLLDMGDNVGGGSPGDGTAIIHELRRRGIGNYLAVIYDPDVVRQFSGVEFGQTRTVRIGGKVDENHGEPVAINATLRSRHDGQFRETELRHGGIRTFDQGETIVVTTEDNGTIVVTSRRMAPFSLQQILSTGIDPRGFHVIIAKGVHAPVAAYAPVCQTLIRVNTPGVTTADMRNLQYRFRRRPLFPFES